MLIMCGNSSAASLVMNGDSITASFPGNTVPATSLYTYKLGAELNRSIVNRAVSGAQAADQSLAATSFVPSANDIHTVLIGANDVRLYPQSKIPMWERFVRDLVLKMAVTNRVNATGSVTLAGSWSNTVVNTVGKNTTQNGAKATATVSGTAVYVSFIIQDSALAGGVVSVKIDGVTVGTIDSTSLGLATHNGASYAPGAVRFGGLSDGNHTVELEVMSSGKIFYLDFIAGSDQAAYPAVYVGNVIRQIFGGYGTDANVAAFNASISSIVSELALDGLNVSLVDESATINPLTDLVDGIHPNAAGHQKIFEAFMAQVGEFLYTPVTIYRRNDGKFFAGDGVDRRELATAP